MGLLKKTIFLKAGSTYNVNILLDQTIKDMGFFDTSDDYDRSTYVDYASTPEYALFNTPYTVSGESFSRLNELEKYVVSTDPAVKFYQSNVITTDGLDLSQSDTTGSGGFFIYTYYLGGIKYVDVTASGSTATTTTFTFSKSGLDPNNFDNKFIVKFESKQNMVENPQIGRDVFIVRQQQPVFERNYRLRALNTLNDTLTYAGGNYFKIYNNT